MATLTTASVDIGALACSISADAAERLANAISCAFLWPEEDGRSLDELQKATILRSLFQHYDGFEATTARELKQELGRAGIATVGLSPELERLLGGNDG
jgi:hypothetical protein